MAAIFRALQASGQIDVVIGSLYVLLLGYIGALMLKDALIALRRGRTVSTRSATLRDAADAWLDGARQD